jgi:hypothetical protein
MMNKVLAAAFVFAFLPVVSSGAIINFDGYSDLTVLSTQNFGDGITFAGATILQCCDTDVTGSLNNSFFPPPADDGGSTDGVNVAYNATGPLVLDFTTPIDSFSAAFTYDNGLTITAYDSTSAVLGVVNGGCGAAGSGSSNYLGSGCGAPNEVLNVNLTGIASIVITGGSGNDFTFDDISFPGSINTPPPGPTPEPGTIGLALGGLACLVAFRRGRHTVTNKPV